MSSSSKGSAREQPDPYALFEDMRERFRKDPERVREEAPVMSIALGLLNTYADEIDRLRDAL